MTKLVDSGSFGNSRGAQVLCEILNKYPRLTRNRMTSLIQSLIEELKQLDYIPNTYYRVVWIQRLRKEYLERIFVHKHLPYEMKDFGPNVVVTLCREQLRRYLRVDKGRMKKRNGKKTTLLIKDEK